MFELSYKYQEVLVEIVGIEKGYSVILHIFLWYNIQTLLAKSFNLTKRREDDHPWNFSN